MSVHGRWIAILAAAFLSALPAGARAQETYADPESMQVVDPEFSYTTSYDRDHTRSSWNQSMSYFGSSHRSSFNISGSVSTLDFDRSLSKSTFGSLNGSLQLQLLGRWMLLVNGAYGMNSSTDGASDIDSRDNRLLIQTQYSIRPKAGLIARASVFTEFSTQHDLTIVQRLERRLPFDDSTVVDSSIAIRDSSYTHSRKDGLSGNVLWTPVRWLETFTKGFANRVGPSIERFKSSYTNPLDGSQGGHSERSFGVTDDPSTNTRIDSRATITRIPRTKVEFYGERSRLEQTSNDRQRSETETATFDRNLGTLHVESSPRNGWFLTVDASMNRSLSQYLVNRSRTKLSKQQRLLATLNYTDSSTFVSASMNVDRDRTDLQPSSNGIQIIRMLNGNATRRLTHRFALSALGSVMLQVNDYLKDEIDRDNLRTFLNVGGSYRVSPGCSTHVSFSRSEGHSVALDPGASGNNAVTTTYQMNAALRLRPNANFTVSQDYLLRAEYRIGDYTDTHDALVRSRRIDTDIVDTLFSVAFVRLTHNFVFQDFGAFSRGVGGRDPEFRVASETYTQTLTAGAGLQITPGVLLVASQGILNNRTHSIRSRARTNQNTWKLNVGLQVFRTLSNGLQINGAIRKIGEYNQEPPPAGQPPPEERDDWIAGVTFHRDF